MKSFMTLLMAFVLTFTCTLALAQLPVEPPTIVVAEEVAVRVFMIEDPTGGNWYRRNALGMAAWGAQNEAACWTVERDAVRTLSGMFGDRAKRSVVREFLIVVVNE
jgi:hypothetical protein